MSSGTPDKWVPAAWPLDAHAAALLSEWLAEPRYTLVLVDADLRGADLSGAEFFSSYWNNADLRGVRMREIDLYRSSLGGARLDGADLTGAGLVRADLDEVSLVDAVLDRADLGRASMINVDARGASFRDCDFGDAIVSNTDRRGADFRGADLRGAVLSQASFRIRVDETTRFEGMRGRFLGPFVVVSEGAERELDGDDLREWLSLKGADVEIMVPKYPRHR
jgi:Pentapeptide repeats (8 copies)